MIFETLTVQQEGGVLQGPDYFTPHVELTRIREYREEAAKLTGQFNPGVRHALCCEGVGNLQPDGTGIRADPPAGARLSILPDGVDQIGGLVRVPPARFCLQPKILRAFLYIEGLTDTKVCWMFARRWPIFARSTVTDRRRGRSPGCHRQQATRSPIMWKDLRPTRGGAGFRRCSVGLSTLLSLWLAGCARKPPAAPPPPEVTIAPVVAQELTEWDQYQGRFEAVEAVEVRPRVSGYLQRVGFVEGSEVHKGDVLFEIDPRPYAATLDERKADLSRARAREALTGRDVERGQRLIAVKAISQEEMDTRSTVASEASAAVLAGEAAVRAAELDLEFTVVRAPISGRVGRAVVTGGNLVSGGVGGSTLLTTIVSLDPIYVLFEGDESAYLRYTHLDKSGERPSSRTTANPVQVGLADETGFPHAGRMEFVDNQLDPATGTIQARAILPNADRLFSPGMFARVRLLGATKRKVLLVPEAAIGTDQDRKFVYVMGRDSTVAYRGILLGRQADGQLRVVRDGLQAGEMIVVNGLARIRPGIKVRAALAPADSIARTTP